MAPLTESLEDLIRETKVLLVLFGEDTCGPCRALRKKLDIWLDAHPDVRGRYAEVGDHLSLCAQRGIFSGPALVLYMDGKETARASGHFSLDVFLARTERYMEMRK